MHRTLSGGSHVRVKFALYYNEFLRFGLGRCHLTAPPPPFHIVPGAVVVPPRKQQPQPPSLMADGPATMARAAKLWLCVPSVPRRNGAIGGCQFQYMQPATTTIRNHVNRTQCTQKHHQIQAISFSEGIQMSNGSKFVRFFARSFRFFLFFFNILGRYSFILSFSFCRFVRTRKIYVHSFVLDPCSLSMRFSLFSIKAIFPPWVAMGVASISPRVCLNDMFSNGLC